MTTSFIYYILSIISIYYIFKLSLCHIKNKEQR